MLFRLFVFFGALSHSVSAGRLTGSQSTAADILLEQVNLAFSWTRRDLRCFRCDGFPRPLVKFDAFYACSDPPPAAPWLAFCFWRFVKPHHGPRCGRCAFPFYLDDPWSHLSVFFAPFFVSPGGKFFVNKFVDPAFVCSVFPPPKGRHPASGTFHTGFCPSQRLFSDRALTLPSIRRSSNPSPFCSALKSR